MEFILGLIKNHRTAYVRNKCNGYLDNDVNGTKGDVWITIVRNPYDRLFSWFKFCIHGYHGEIPTPTHINLCDHIDEKLLKTPNMSKREVQVLFDDWLFATKKVFENGKPTKQTPSQGFCDDRVKFVPKFCEYSQIDFVNLLKPL